MASPKTVLVTGASSGIGRATAEYFAAQGWNVAATMRTPETSDLAGTSPRIALFRLDVTDVASIDAAVAEVMTRFGRIDALVNNAGYGLIGLFEGMSADQIRRNIDTNVIGMMNVTRAVLPHMRRAKSGRIVNIGSAAGRVTLPLYSLYCATKHAVEGFSEGLNYELAQHGIRVKVIEPGPIKSEFFGRSLDRAATAGLEDYGDWESRIFQAIDMKCQNPPGPELVAKAAFKAASARLGWRLRYKPNGWFLVLRRQLVPGELYVRAVRRILGAW